VKIIQVPDKFLQVDGYPFRIPIRDEEGKERPLVKDGVEQRDSAGGTLLETHNASFAEMLKLFLNAMFRLSQQEIAQARMQRKEPPEEFTLEDSALALDIYRALNVISNNQLALERHPHEWLLKQIDLWGVKILGMNAAILKEPIAGAIDQESNRDERKRETA